MFQFNLIKHLTINFGGSKKFEVGNGNGSDTVLVGSSSLAPQAVDLSKAKKQLNKRKIIGTSTKL